MSLRNVINPPDLFVVFSFWSLLYFMYMYFILGKWKKSFSRVKTNFVEWQTIFRQMFGWLLINFVSVAAPWVSLLYISVRKLVCFTEDQQREFKLLVRDLFVVEIYGFFSCTASTGVSDIIMLLKKPGKILLKF